jgi:hypothetical protein
MILGQRNRMSPPRNGGTALGWVVVAAEAGEDCFEQWHGVHYLS